MQNQRNVSEPIDSVEAYEFEPIRGYPVLNWKGKRPFLSTQYYPAQLKETYGEEVDGWRNKIYRGDNLQVMSHLLKTYRGQINLIYIDPPFDSKADYKKRIELRGKEAENDRTAFEEKQYTDIWINDEYLQFMYERLILMRALLADTGSIYLHCDPAKGHYLKLLMDEIFGADLFQNEIIWYYKNASRGKNRLAKAHEIILWYTKSPSPDNYIFNRDEILVPFESGMTEWRYKRGGQSGNEMPQGKTPDDVIILPALNTMDRERLGYPTQKPEILLERIIKTSSNLGDLVFDCFMGSGTTQAVAMKLGRRFIGVDINLGAVEITTQRLTDLATEISENTQTGYQELSGGGGSPLSIPALKSTTSTTTTCSETLLKPRVSSLKLWRFRSYLLVAFMMVRRMDAWSRSCRLIASPPAPT